MATPPDQTIAPATTLAGSSFAALYADRRALFLSTPRLLSAESQGGGEEGGEEDSLKPPTLDPRRSRRGWLCCQAPFSPSSPCYEDQVERERAAKKKMSGGSVGGGGSGGAILPARKRASTSMPPPNSLDPSCRPDAALLLATQPLPVAGRLRKLSEAFFNSQNGDKIDLMNDWEIGGTQNKWVCPSDRHLQLRAQLKSGWSVRTVGARSPTAAKAATPQGGMTDAEKEHIRQVLARADESKAREQQRIGKMVDRLDKMRNRATGDGLSHCLLCRTEFGLLAAKSYAAMCMHCRKYVCQRNCGVETTDGGNGEVLFLCKICSEAREVLWKKSGAWFYKEMPDYVRNNDPSGMLTSPPGMSNGDALRSSPGNGHLPMPVVMGGQRRPMDPPIRGRLLSTHLGSASASTRDPYEEDRSRSPRPRITPSWVKDKVMSSMSVEEPTSSTPVGNGPGPSTSDSTPGGTPGPSRRGGEGSSHGRGAKMDDDHSSSDGEFVQSGVRKPPMSKREMNLAKFAMATARMSESDEDSSGDSRPSSRSTSPRRSLATPSSYDSHHHIHHVAPSMSMHATNNEDARSIDSGVVRSDHSLEAGTATAAIGGGFNSTLTPYSSSSGSSNHVSPPPPDLSTLLLHKASLNHTADTGYASPRERENIFRTSSPAMVPTSSNHSSVGVPSSHRNSHESLRGDIQPDSRASLVRVQEEPAVECVASASFMSSPDDDSTAIARRSPIVGSRPGTSAEPEAPAPSSSLGPAPGSPVAAPTRRSSVGTEDDDGGSLGSIQFTVTYSADIKQLAIHLIRAKGLKAMDKNGFSDPYVKLHLIPGNVKATKLTSKTIDKTLNPEWNETLVYHGVTAEDKDKKSLRVTVLDRDRIGSDFLGETRVALKKLQDNTTKKFHLWLENAIPVVTDKSAEDERGKLLVGLCYNVQQGSLFVSIKRGAEFVGMDSSGFSDPYCKVNLTPYTSKGHRQRTSVKKRTLNPEFNETLTYIVPYKDLRKKTLQILVYDHDVAKTDDYIGGVLLSSSAKGDRSKHWIECIESPGQTIEYWHKLELQD